MYTKFIYMCIYQMLSNINTLHYLTLLYITLHCTTLHFVTSHYIT